MNKKRKLLQDDIKKGIISTGMNTFIINLHRRAGKDFLAYNYMIHEAYYNPGTYVISLPTIKQAVMIYIDSPLINGLPVTSLIPPEILSRVDRQSNKIYIKNIMGGESVIVLSHNSAESLVGMAVNGIILSEFAVAPSNVLQYMSQSITERKGFAIVISTPRGMNQFYDLYKANENNKYGFSITMNIDDTKNIDGKPLFIWDDILNDIKYGIIPDEETANQEFKCSWVSASGNSFYKHQTKQCEDENRHLIAKYNPNEELVVSMDLGTRDKAVLTFAQYDRVFDRINTLTTYSNNYQDIKHYLDKMEDICYEKGWRQVDEVFLPHDSTKERIETMTSVDQMVQDRGYDTIVVPKIAEKIIAINKVRSVFWKCQFNDDSFKMFTMLKAHEKRLDTTTGLYLDVPVHGKASDYADSFETLIRGFEIKYTGHNDVSISRFKI